ncbi:multifunctional CCA tRNA nucleotidyl transferase/2'3'-cyclic phosphodiesterase/2'nucleotidase/phosphatase [Marinobacter xestospongiae]|uniref:multifunctional CCA tRNA nucleotidyl transferase/2'3'-cyclic phosphodiesterase/2'nucleotidase/phosphatase n=1 Tax=Marinobacter xestospongiae TaxID=994319 RepID=UPI0020066AC9|nr:multifunctional CCA tRNA nucleotidyl transferase/2'3'-cyclic phosphodiesterase/2'nucleotidase/phosphatase [Marinobacter xestospongiae]MCK7565080.1 multifunctional CCA tRNA nucleotidyl transferase/2'3'-cyclic phosphodiesterase/2'nucleotidase/phosphatase [Marinobacter xestospongiae]
MEIYLVGGAVRDDLLQLPVKDRDWVVVGATPEDMLAKGFKQVGADFPVFLHPDSHEEYALARTERKQGHGYHGFTVYSAPDVTLEDDLIRRDLTINAMARDQAGQVVDPFNGQADLKARRLRHVSPAFSEDPLRILRTARFAARFAPLGFTVAEETQALMARMTADGEVAHLVAERVWQEIQRALHEQAPEVFFQVLRDCGALEVLIPELAPAETFNQAMATLRCLAPTAATTEMRLAGLLSPLTARIAQARAKALKAPNDGIQLTALVAGQGPEAACIVNQPDAEALLGWLERVDAWRKADRFERLLQTCRCTHAALTADQADWLSKARDLTARVDAQALMAEGHQGKALGDAIRKEKLARLQRLTQNAVY